MRKTSQDGGDATSATSGVENEVKKPKSGLLLEFKAKKISKRTAPNLSEESDDAVVEPLLQKTTDKTIQSAKYFAKAKADTVKEISKLFNDKKTQSASTSSGFGTTESLLSEKDQTPSKSNPISSAPLHNYMNTNVFHSHDSSKANGITKTQVLVEIDGSKQSGYNPSPLIFTTAKIHIDGKSKNMEPVQMTPGPILSTVEVSVLKGGNITTNEKKISNGTSVMNTVFSQQHVNVKAKENTAQPSSSNVTQSKDNIMIDKNCNPETLPTKAISPTENRSQIDDKIEESTVIISKSNNTQSVAQSIDVISKTANPSKSLTTGSNNPIEVSASLETFKPTTVDVKNKLDKSKEIKGAKKLVDEPRILMSESKLKTTISDNAKTISSIKSAKSPIEPTKTIDSSTKQPQTSQSNKNDKPKSEINKSNFGQDKDLKPLQNINIKSPVSKEQTGKSNTVSTKSLQQKNTPTELSTSLSSPKIPTQSKVVNSKLSKEVVKSPKPSANEIGKPTFKIITANSSTTSTSASTVNPAPNISSPNAVSSHSTDTSNKTINISPSSNLKATTSTVTTSATNTVSTTAIKTQPSSSKTATTIASAKSTSIKSSGKQSTSSVKSPQISTATSATKPPNATSKTSGKPPPLAFTKTPPVDTSSPGVTAPVVKPTVSKVAQVSSSTTGHKSTSSSALVSSSAVGETSNKTKVVESNKKGGTKPSDHTKDTKVSKA